MPGSEASIGHLENPVMYSPDGTSRVIRLHKTGGLDPARIESLIGPFYMVEIVEIDGCTYGMFYAMQHKEREPKANLLASLLRGGAISGPAILAADHHVDVVVCAEYSARREEEILTRLEKEWDDAYERGVVPPGTPRPDFRKPVEEGNHDTPREN